MKIGSLENFQFSDEEKNVLTTENLMAIAKAILDFRETDGQKGVK